MTRRLDTLSLGTCVAGLLSLLFAGGDTLAANSNAYLKGSFQTIIIAGDIGDQFTVTFDGQGNITSTGVVNCAGSVAAGLPSGLSTYSVQADGSLTVTGTNNGVCGGATPATFNGNLSSDGNSFVLTAIQSGEAPEIMVGIRLGSVSSLNTPSGILALNSNTTGYDNAALGAYSMFSNTTGYANSAVGYDALYANLSGANNNAQGGHALYSNTTGYGNSAVGVNALENLTTGFRNVAIGNNTGLALQGGSYNVDIGWGVSGAGDETGVMRIGSPGYAQQTYIAGITNSQVTGAPVYVTASGQLGVLASSERYKTDIAALPSDNERLLQLQPVTFHLKSEPNGALQYGLIAEQVEKVYPELVLRDAQGQLQGVRYDELAPILLSQMQQQQLTIAAQDSELAEAREQIAAQAEDVRDLKRELAYLKRLEEVANRGTADREAQDQ
jgi:endosialidase-like protein